MINKQIEHRMCVACRAVKHKSLLVRIVRSPDGMISFDTTGKAQGHGAYLCRSHDCFAKAKKKRLFNRMFKTQIDEAVYDEINLYLENLNGSTSAR